jgi:hypothetical protein
MLQLLLRSNLSTHTSLQLGLRVEMTSRAMNFHPEVRECCVQAVTGVQSQYRHSHIQLQVRHSLDARDVDGALSNGRVRAMRGVGSMVRRATDGGTGEERSTTRQALSSRLAGGGALRALSLQQTPTYTLHPRPQSFEMAVEMIDLVDEPRREFLHVRGVPDSIRIPIDVCRQSPLPQT